jgi:ankyrin repeat protein
VDEKLKQNAIFYAMLIKDEAQSLKVTEYLAKECGLDCTLTDELSQTALFYAAREGKLSVVTFLWQAGCKVDQVDIYG